MNKEQIYKRVQQHYASVANGRNIGDYGQTIARAFGYSEEELHNIPRNSNLGLSCGNPLALAKIREDLTKNQGETVIDLGSGAGFDIFIAAKRVGSTGKAIGIDMNKDMLMLANKNKAEAMAENVSFIESLITDVPLPEATADCIISNCVLNLVPESEKPCVFREMFRLLKPGGRIAISDVLTNYELPVSLKNHMALYVGCIAGASQVKDYELYLRGAGFADILLLDTGADLNIYKTAREGTKKCVGDSDGREHDHREETPTCCMSMQQETETSSLRIETGVEEIDFNELASSFKIYATKPAE